MKETVDEEGYILYNGLRSGHWLADGTRIEIEKSHDGKGICWYRLICGPHGWGVLEILNTAQVRERLND